MRSELLLCLMLFLSVGMTAQNGANPFELVPRLDPELREAATTNIPEKETITTNPFEIKGQVITPSEQVSTNTSSGNPFDIVDGETAGEKPVAEIPVVSPALEPGKGESHAIEARANTGVKLAISLFLLTFSALSLLFFRGIYAKCYRALFNDNLLSQLYREREAGALGSFLIMYAVFFAAAGFFISLAGQHYGLFSSSSLWYFTWISASGVAGLLVLKHFALAFLGYVFPIGKETGRYSFAIMVFSIVGGLILSMGVLLLAYAPEGAEEVLIWGTLSVLVLLYLLRALRGLFIANRFVFNYQFHFLSYICAVEIGPALCLLKLLTDF